MKELVDFVILFILYIFIFYKRWKVKGKDKTQEQLDEQILSNATRNFYKPTNVFRGNRSMENQTQSRVA